MILVFGSLNMDLVLAAAAIPRPGETVIGEGYRTLPGGKGDNQAVAAGPRRGAGELMAGAVGAAAFGRALHREPAPGGRVVGTDLVATADRPDRHRHDHRRPGGGEMRSPSPPAPTSRSPPRRCRMPP